MKLHFINCAATLVAFAMASSLARGEIAIKDGQTLALLGDSITQQGAASRGGYVKLVVSGLEANGIKVKLIGAGRSGDKSNQMLARLDRDVLSKKPDWMTLSCGVNDVWHGKNGVTLDDYKSNITAIVEQDQRAGVKLMILTSTVIGEDLDNQNNQKLASYNEFLRALAKKKNCRLADLSADMQPLLKEGSKKSRLLTVDGVHMNPAGNRLMAKGVLRAFGLDKSELLNAEKAWDLNMRSAPSNSPAANSH